jgi:uracil-DNA glycosylase
MNVPPAREAMWLVGQAPSRESDPTRPFSGRSGARLAALAGVEHDRLAEAFRLRNVIDWYPGPGRGGEKGDAFPMRVARPAAIALARTFEIGASVILVGLNVARAFRVGSEKPLTWFRCAVVHDLPGGVARFVGFRAAIIPHPSGINRWWNEPANELAAAEFLREAAVLG